MRNSWVWLELAAVITGVSFFAGGIVLATVGG